MGIASVTETIMLTGTGFLSSGSVLLRPNHASQPRGCAGPEVFLWCASLSDQQSRATATTCQPKLVFSSLQLSAHSVLRAATLNPRSSVTYWAKLWWRTQIWPLQETNIQAKLSQENQTGGDYSHDESFNFSFHPQLFEQQVKFGKQV